MDAFNLYSQMERDDVLIAFKGSITSELLTSVLQIMETKMEDLHEAPRTRKKVFNVLVECLQNLYHHIDEFEVVGTPEEISEKSQLFLVLVDLLNLTILLPVILFLRIMLII